MKKIIFLFCFCLTILGGLKAQNEDDIIDYTNQSSSIDSVKVENVKDSFLDNFAKHELTFQSLHWIRNKFNIEYRKNLNEIFSLGLGVGYNYRQDNILHLSSELGYIFEAEGNSLSYLLLEGEYLYGFNCNPSLRFFYDSWFFENAFVQLDYRYNFNRYLLNYDTPGFFLKTNFYSSTLNLIFGMKGSFLLNQKYLFVNTFYYGFGGNYYTTYSIEKESYYKLNQPLSKENSVSFKFLIGYSFGLGFTKNRK
ncbi:MAG: hypothetical protein CMD18_04385 [Flavobacteriales bacterium]|nr:hypothetical protein [Flavobacteriales bacterium]|tara:strand:- start:8820 stop:9575 length:756 start_codon:yes stop_codon:yes gene_type:complete